MRIAIMTGSVNILKTGGGFHRHKVGPLTCKNKSRCLLQRGGMIF